jgi:hypothetical protein
MGIALTAVLAVCMMVAGIVIAPKGGSVAAAELFTQAERMQSGLRFMSAAQTYDVEKPLSTMPKTFEAILHLPKSYSARGGILFGTFGPTNKTACYSFEVYTNGMPKLYYDVDNVGSTNPAVVNINFTEVDVRSDGFVHLVITHDTANSKAYCYIDGELKQTVDVKSNGDVATYYNGFNFVPTASPRIR